MDNTLDSLIAVKIRKEGLAQEAKDLLRPAKESHVEFTRDQLYSVISERLEEQKFFGKRLVSLKKKPGSCVF